MASRSASISSPPSSARPATPQELLLQGLALHNAGDLPRAASLYQAVLAQQPRHFDALHLLGVVALQLGHPERARVLLDAAIGIRADVAAAHFNLGNALADLRRSDQAIASYDRALALQPDHAEAHNNRGNSLRAVGRHEAAAESLGRALALNPANAGTHCNLGNVLLHQGRYAEALACFDKAIVLDPATGLGHRQRGVCLELLGDPAAALSCHDLALQFAADDADTYNARGNAQRALGNAPAALADYARAIAIDPAHRQAHFNRGAVFDDLKQHEAAIDSYETVLSLQPDHPYAAGLLLMARRQICRWDDDAGCVAALVTDILARRRVAMPFHSVALTHRAEAQRLATELWVRDRHPARFELPPCGVRQAGERIRIGYFSADFREHATCHLVAGLLETHDRRRFEISAFSFGPDTGDPMRRRVAAACDAFLDVPELRAKEIAVLSRERGIDIAVDLKGFTGDSRMDIFAHRAAPLQVSYLGFPGTSGAEYMDYLVADSTLIPQAERGHYTEKIVHLPYTYQANDAARKISGRCFTRAELSLPDPGFVFCCFNNHFKISPAVFAAWMRILQRVSGSVLWLLQDNPTAACNLRREAAARDVDPARLIFALRLPVAEHLARQRAADLFLDTSPYNAHTTASDALWAGLPVLTLAGDTFAGRVGASVLGAVGLSELVASSPEHFEELAVELAQDPRRLGAIRAALAANLSSMPLFDTARFTRHLEAAYAAMFARHQAGLAPDHLVVAANGGVAAGVQTASEVQPTSAVA